MAAAAAAPLPMAIYCDYNATTPLRPEALEAMLPFLREHFGNPSSVHRFGARARDAVEEARCAVAELVGAPPSAVVFTSGGTEANALALLGAGRGLESPRCRTVLSCAIEHSSVRAPVNDLVASGMASRLAPLGAQGQLDLDSLADGDWDDVAIASVAWANNEIGTVQPLERLSAECRRRRVLLHSDAVQAAGKIPVAAALVDLLSLSAHKLGGPKGVGALVVRPGTPLRALIRGGGQERELRGGTENVAGIVGFGAACRAAQRGLEEFIPAATGWRETLWQAINEAIPAVTRNSAGGADCLPNTLNVSIAGVRGEALVAALDLAGVAISSGAACSAGAGEPSHVLLALGRSDDEARNGVRFSCGWHDSPSAVAPIVAALRTAVDRIRSARQGRPV